nr:hypothetical protein [uncultured Rhodopila sp.]
MNENAQIPLPLPSNGMSVVVSSPRLLRGDRIDRLGVKYEFLEREPTRKKFLRVDTDAMVWIDNIELVSQMARREVTIALPDWLPAARARKWGQDFHSMPETDKLRARMRLAYVEAFLENRRLGYPQKVRALLDEVHRKRMQDPKAVEAGEWKPCLAAVYEWVEIWEAPKGPKGIKRLCFAESERGVRGVQVEDSIAPLLHTAIKDLWFTSQRTRVKHVFDRVITDARAAGIPDVYYPSERTVRRAINGLPPYAVARARFGLRAAEEEYRSKGQLPPTPLPGQVYELDAHKLDFVAVDDRFGLPLGRLWITAVIDRCTRVIVGFHLHVGKRKLSAAYRFGSA